jgi:hypothetical protein
VPQYMATANSVPSAGGPLTLLFISLVLTVIGVAVAFDVGGVASKNYENNRGASPWGRKHNTVATNVKPYAVFGWLFLIPGVALLLLSIVALL